MNEKYEQIFSEFIKTYKSGEDYSPRHEYPCTDIETVPKLIRQKKIAPLKALFIQNVTKNLFSELAKFYYEKHGKQIERIALDQAILQLTQHGECGIQAGGLIFALMNENFPTVMRGRLEEDLHGFVIIPSSAQNPTNIVLDPFFKLICPMKEYFTNQQILQYGRAETKNPNWMPNANKTQIESYSQDTYINKLSFIKQQIDDVMKFRNMPFVTSWLNLLNYSLSLNENNYNETALTQYMRTLFTKEYKKDNKADDKSIQLFINRYLPLPKPVLNNNSLFSPSAHDQLVAKFKDIIKQLNRGQNLLQLLDEKKYGSVLRTACNDHLGLKFVECLLAYKDKIGLDINERPQTSQKAAIDYAMKFDDKKCYNLLIEHGAIPPTNQLAYSI